MDSRGRLRLAVFAVTWAAAMALPAAVRAGSRGISCPTRPDEGGEKGTQMGVASVGEKGLPATIDAARPPHTEVAVFALG